MNILVTAIGTLAATNIIKQLKKNKEINIYGGDIFIREYLVTSKEVEHFTVFPSVIEDKSYLEFVLNFCRLNNIQYIFPTIDEEVELFSQYRFKFEEINTIPCIPSEDIVDLCRDKYKTFEFIKKAVPELYIETKTVDMITESINYPSFIKPRKGRGSIGCFEVHDEIDFAYISKKIVKEEYLIQPLCRGKIVSIDVVAEYETNQIQMIMREEVIRNKNGAATVVKIIKDSQLEKICTKLIIALKVTGIINIEVFVDADKDIYTLIEINPRFPAGAEFSCYAGVNLVEQYFDLVQGKPWKIEVPKIDKVYVRRYEIYDNN